jgi:hypothetical protein
MRWPAVMLGVCLVALAAYIGVAKPVQAEPQAGCGPTVVFLVWPHGHPAIVRYSEFPEIRNPHIELYVGTKGYDVSHAGAWIIGGKPPAGITRAGFFTNCANYGDTVTTGVVANARVVTRETAVKCSGLKGSPVVDEKLRAKGVSDLYLHSGTKMIATAHVTPTRVRLTVPKSCVLIAPPRP